MLCRSWSPHPQSFHTVNDIILTRQSAKGEYMWLRYWCNWAGVSVTHACLALSIGTALSVRVVMYSLFCWGIYAEGQSKYILVFSLLLFLCSFLFTFHLLFPFFFEIFLIFVVTLFTSKPCQPDTALLICFCLGTSFPAHYAESNSCIICFYLSTAFPMHHVESNKGLPVRS